MLPLSSNRSSTRRTSNFAYRASRTPRATFSKSQKTARLLLSFIVAPARPSVADPELEIGARDLFQGEDEGGRAVIGYVLSRPAHLANGVPGDAHRVVQAGAYQVELPCAGLQCRGDVRGHARAGRFLDHGDDLPPARFLEPAVQPAEADVRHVLHPLEVGDGDAARVAVDVREDRLAPAIQDLVGLGSRRPV